MRSSDGFLECQLRQGRIFINCLIVTEDICCSVQRDTEYSQFITHCLRQLDGVLHRLKFTSKRACFNRILGLTVPNDWCLVTKQEYPSLRSSRSSIATVTSIDKAVRQHRVTAWLWHIQRYCFRRIAIKVAPIVLFQHALADLWVLKVKGNLPLRVDLEIPKHAMQLQEMPFSGHCHVRQHQGNLKQHVDSPQFHRPP